VDATRQPEKEIANASNDEVPSFLTPPSEGLIYTTQNYGIAHEAAMGGAQTM
jgi:hypothetical protein